MTRCLLCAALAALLFAAAGCGATYMETMGSGGSVLYRHAAMNCPVCEGRGYYMLGKQRVRCYHCRGVGLVMGWSRIRPSDEATARSHALAEGEGDEYLSD